LRLLPAASILTRSAARRDHTSGALDNPCCNDVKRCGTTLEGIGVLTDESREASGFGVNVHEERRLSWPIDRPGANFGMAESAEINASRCLSNSPLRNIREGLNSPDIERAAYVRIVTGRSPYALRTKIGELWHRTHAPALRTLLSCPALATLSRAEATI
jgi:hypothetical protein